jgi:hypothetical protein
VILEASAARWLLVLHTALGVAAVAASTHLCVWLARYLRGAAGRRRAVRRFAVIALALQAAAFAAGNLAYPTYKTRVRAEYLDSPDTINADAEARVRRTAAVRARVLGEPPRVLDDGAVAREIAGLAGGADRMARWFDSKEHWVALGLALALAIAAVLRAWDPERDGRAPAPFVMMAALGACATLWYAAVVGVLTATWRAI